MDELGNGGCEHGFGELLDRSRSFSDGNELVRSDEAELRVLPTDEGFETRDLAVGEPQLGLIQHDQLTVRDGCCQIAGQGQPPRRVRIALDAVEVDPLAEARLGPVHRHVGTLEQCGRLGRVVGRQCETDADADVDADTVDVHRHAEGGLDHPSCAFEVVRRGSRGEQECELVAAEPCDRDVGLDCVANSLGRLDEDPIAGVVSEGVVDLLESVQIHHRHSKVGDGAPSASWSANRVRRWLKRTRFGRPVRESWSDSCSR